MRYGYPPSRIKITLEESQEPAIIFSYDIDDRSLKAVKDALEKINEELNILMIYKVERVLLLNKVGNQKAELRLQV